MNDPAQPRSISVAGLLSVALAAGLAAGWTETGLALFSRLFRGRLWLFGPELVWVTPLAEAGIFLVFGALWIGPSRVVRRLGTSGVVAGLFGALATFAVLIGFDQIHWAASILLAVGIGTAFGRLAGRAGVSAVAVAAKAAGVGIALVAVAAGSQSAAARLAGMRSAPVTASARADHPNILLLVLDTVRAWNLGLYGYARGTTPHLDRRFAGGVVFDRVLAAAPWTLASHASMFTGRWPTALSANWDRPLDERQATLAEVLRTAGYSTGGFIGNYRFAGRSTGLARGFDQYVDYPLDLAEALRMSGMVRRILRYPALQEWLGKNRIIEARSAAAVNRDLLAWVDRHPGRPFFAFANYVDGHAPYLPPAPYDSLWTKAKGQDYDVSRRNVEEIKQVFQAAALLQDPLAEYVDGYDGSISYLDVQIDSLLGALDRRGRLANTIVILTADHGEQFGEHGLIQHGNSLYLPLLHVPLAIWGPGRIPPGLRIGNTSSLRNLAATVADLAGVDRSRLGGRSLAAFWRADSLDVPADTVVSAVDWYPTLSKSPASPLLDGSLRSILADSTHYIVRSDGVEELYDVGRDFLETRNLVGMPTYRPALLAARARLKQVLGENRGPRP